jgi:hypothetical protein
MHSSNFRHTVVLAHCILLAGTACAVAGLNNVKGINCCGDGENDIFGSARWKGFFLTGSGTYEGIDFW